MLIPALCIVQVIGTDFLRASSTDETLYYMRISFTASCLDEDHYLVAFEVDSVGVPINYSFNGTVDLSGDETELTKNAKIAAAALAGFGSISVPVVFL